MTTLKEIGQMTIPELEKKLLMLWNKADNLQNNSAEYNKIVGEVFAIRNYCRDNNIKLNQSIEARF